MFNGLKEPWVSLTQPKENWVELQKMLFFSSDNLLLMKLKGGNVFGKVFKVEMV